MADGDPTQQLIDPKQIDAIMAALTPQQPTPQPQQADMSQQPFTSLLGLALGGGPQVGMSPQETTAAGNRALLNFGVGMLGASGYSPIRRTLGEALAQGYQGAEQSLAGSEAVTAAQKAAQQQYQQQQIANRAEALKTGMSMQELQLKLAQLRAAGAAAQTATTGLTKPGSTPGTLESGTAIARDPNVPTVGEQAHNPGNVMADSGLPIGATGWIPAAGGRRVAAYPDNATGIAGNAYTLGNYANSGVNTVRAAVTRWVGDPKADLTSYVADVAKALKVGPDDKIDLNDPKVQAAFIQAQQPHETGKAWFTPADVESGVALAGQWRAGKNLPQPAGTTTTAAVTPPPAPATKATTPPAPTPAAVAAAVPGSGSPLATPPSATPTTTPPAPPPAESPAVTTAKATAAKTGQATPIEGVPGMVAHPDGSVGPAPSVGMGGKKTTAAPAVPGGSATLGSATLPFTPYQVAGTDTGPPTSSLGLIGQAARAAEEGRPTPVAGATPLGAVGGGGPLAQPTTAAPVAPAPAPPVVAPPTPTPATPPGEVPSTFTYTEKPLPKLLQDRIDHPENDPSIAGLDTSIRTMAQLLASGDTSVARQLQAAQEARATAIRSVLADAIAKGQEWQDKNRTTDQATWRTAYDAQQAVKLKQLEGSQAVTLAQTTANIQQRQKVLEGLETDSKADEAKLQQLQLLHELSARAGPASLLTPEIREGLMRIGWATQDQANTWSAQNALDAANQQLITAMRQGTGFQRTTNMDLQFLLHSTPGGSMQPEEFRDATGAFLMSASRRNLNFNRLVQGYMTDPSVTYADAAARADKELGPIIQQMPSGLSGSDPGKWVWDNVMPGEFYKKPGGGLAIFKPKATDVRPE